MLACDLGRPIIFIDQFEEFVQAHRGAAQLGVLGNDVNDLLRALQNRASLVLSLHPAAESVIMLAAGQYIKTLAPITQETMITVPPMTPKDGIKLASVYLSEYRSKNSTKPLTHPFSEEALEYICQKTEGNPRLFIMALHNAIWEGAEKDYALIDADFISDPSNHAKVLMGASNDWAKFISSKK
jgi:hypothetical protein